MCLCLCFCVCACLYTHVHAEVPLTLYACACMSLCVHVNMWIFANDCDHGFFCLGTSLHLSQYVGVIAIAPWLRSVSKCQYWVVVGEGLQCPTLGNGFLARKAVVFLVILHLLPLLLLRRLPQFRLSLVIYPPLLPELSLPLPPLPSLPTPPSPTLPTEHPAWKALVLPLAPVWPGPNAVSFPLQVGAGALCRQ